MTTRDRVLDAAEKVIHDLGLARATTKQIARQAGYSEATLYKHFRDKQDLFLCLLRERLPQFVGLTKDLPQRVGTGTVRATLREVASAALAFYERSFPMAASIFSEPGLLAAQRDSVRAAGAGPHKAHEALAAYLREEQRGGRVSHLADPDAAATLLVGACFYHAFLAGFYGQPISPRARTKLAGTLVDSIVEGLQPPRGKR